MKFYESALETYDYLMKNGFPPGILSMSQGLHVEGEPYAYRVIDSVPAKNEIILLQAIKPSNGVRKKITLSLQDFKDKVWNNSDNKGILARIDREFMSAPKSQSLYNDIAGKIRAHKYFASHGVSPDCIDNSRVFSIPNVDGLFAIVDVDEQQNSVILKEPYSNKLATIAIPFNDFVKDFLHTTIGAKKYVPLPKSVLGDIIKKNNGGYEYISGEPTKNRFARHGSEKNPTARRIHPDNLPFDYFDDIDTDDTQNNTPEGIFSKLGIPKEVLNGKPIGSNSDGWFVYKGIKPSELSGNLGRVPYIDFVPYVDSTVSPMARKHLEKVVRSFPASKVVNEWELKNESVFDASFRNKVSGLVEAFKNDVRMEATRYLERVTEERKGMFKDYPFPLLTEFMSYRCPLIIPGEQGATYTITNMTTDENGEVLFGLSIADEGKTYPGREKSTHRSGKKINTEQLIKYAARMLRLDQSKPKEERIFAKGKDGYYVVRNSVADINRNKRITNNKLMSRSRGDNDFGKSTVPFSPGQTFLKNFARKKA